MSTTAGNASATTAAGKSAGKSSAATAASSAKTHYGILAEFANPGELYHAAQKVNKEGFKEYDTFSPFPIHGMDKAMSLKKSKLGWIVIVHALMGLTGAFAMMYFMSVIDYPINISGKPFANIPAWVPIMFELTILLSAFGTVFGMLFLNGLPRLNHPLFTSERFKKVTDDGFFLCIESTDSKFDAEQVRGLLRDLGASHIEDIHSD
ncbi:MAG: DUF3341 domain-containing protein [Rhodothermaceae bacterium TMED105]|nr:MAG: DUF3341 domain-containing protein [Rhodothermaceae bacterium TMED105]